MAQDTTAIQKMYVAYFGRPADPAGLQYWHDLIESKVADLAAVGKAFSESNEYKALVAGKTSTTIVENIYLQLFGRKPDAGGLSFWANHLDSGKLSIDRACAEIMNGAVGSDMTTVNYKVSVANEFTNKLVLQAVGEVSEYLSKFIAKFAYDAITKVLDASSYMQIMSSLGSKSLVDLVKASVAVGEPNPNGNGVAVGEPNPSKPVQGIAVGEPNPNGLGFAFGEPHPVDGKLMGVSYEHGTSLYLLGVQELDVGFM